MQQRHVPNPASELNFNLSDLAHDADLNLIEAQRSRAIIDVDIDGAAGRYQSVILRVDPTAGAIIIDELFPAGFIGLPGQPLTITVRRADGSRAQFATRVIERRSVNGVDNYQLVLPASIAYEQRREVYRLRLSATRGVVSEFQTADRQFCAATVQDLSATGIRLELQHALPLMDGDVLSELDFEFEQQRFHCHARVRHVYGDRSGKTVVGAVFCDFPRFQQRILERIIMQRQRREVQQTRAENNLSNRQAAVYESAQIAS